MDMIKIRRDHILINEELYPLHIACLIKYLGKYLLDITSESQYYTIIE